MNSRFSYVYPIHNQNQTSSKGSEIERTSSVLPEQIEPYLFLI